MAIICFGQIDKKLIFVLLVTIILTINLIVTNEVPSKYSNNLLKAFLKEIGPIVTGAIMCLIFK